ADAAARPPRCRGCSPCRSRGRAVHRVTRFALPPDFLSSKTLDSPPDCQQGTAHEEANSMTPHTPGESTPVIDADGHVEEDLDNIVARIPAVLQPYGLKLLAHQGGHVT